MTHHQTQEAPFPRVTWEKEAQGAEPLPSGQKAAVTGRKAAGKGFPLVRVMFQHYTHTLQTPDRVCGLYKNTSNRTRLSV